MPLIQRAQGTQADTPGKDPALGVSQRRKNDKTIFEREHNRYLGDAKETREV